MYIDNWKKLEKQIESMVKSLQDPEEHNHWPCPEDDETSEKNDQHDNEIPSKELKQTFLDNLSKLREEETISDL